MSRGAITHDSGYLRGGYGATIFHLVAETYSRTVPSKVSRAAQWLTRLLSHSSCKQIRHLSEETENRLRIRKAERLAANARAQRAADTRLRNRLLHAEPKAALIRREMGI